MGTFTEGDIVTLAFTEGDYLLAKIVYVEELTLNELIHLMVYDTVVEGGPAGYDDQGEYQERTHPEIPDVAGLPVVIDHIALTSPAFEDCDPLLVGRRDVTDDERRGYAVWVALQRERAIRRGQMRPDPEPEEEEIEDVEEFEEEYEEGHEGEFDEVDEEEREEAEEEYEEEREAVADDEIVEGEPTVVETEEGEIIPVTPHTWHEVNFDVSIAQALVELADVFRQEKFADSVVGQMVIEQTEASAEEIRELVDRLVNDGDYGAGQELLLFGDPAADALYAALKETKNEQAADDILQILADIGTDRAYAHITEFFVERIDRLPADTMAVAAARTFCYVVMLTGGTPEPLRRNLRLLERLDYPELRENAEEAIRAVEQQGTEVPEEAPRSTDPFSTL